MGDIGKRSGQHTGTGKKIYKNIYITFQSSGRKD
jgi:hypothetical protein